MSADLKSINSYFRSAAKAVLPLLVLSVGFVLSGCGQPTAPFPNDPRECANKITYDGGALYGRNFKTNITVPKVTQAQAMKRATTLLVSEGWQITNANSEYGTIRASQTAGLGGLPLDISIIKVDNNLRVNMAYTSGVYEAQAPTEFVQNLFCSIAKAIIEGK
jgi:hypothetical protein